MTNTRKTGYRLSEETIRHIRELGLMWGLMVPVQPAKVVEECVRERYEKEYATLPKAKKQKYPDRPLTGDLR